MDKFCSGSVYPTFPLWDTFHLPPPPLWPLPLLFSILNWPLSFFLAIRWIVSKLRPHAICFELNFFILLHQAAKFALLFHSLVETWKWEKKDQKNIAKFDQIVNVVHGDWQEKFHSLHEYIECILLIEREWRVTESSNSNNNNGDFPTLHYMRLHPLSHFPVCLLFKCSRLACVLHLQPRCPPITAYF